MQVFNFFGKLTDKIFSLFMALLLVQFPVYMNQYTDVLAGAHQESETVYLELERAAAEYAQTVESYLNELMSNESPKVRKNAEISWNTVKRYQTYDKALKSLRSSNAFTRPFNFIKHFSGKIHSAVKFKAGVPLTVEGLVYGIIGIILAMILSGLFGKMFRKNKAEPVTQV